MLVVHNRTDGHSISVFGYCLITVWYCVHVYGVYMFPCSLHLLAAETREERRKTGMCVCVSVDVGCPCVHQCECCC